ncbi:TonB-dependent receptor [Rhodoplanes sp. TEM]|uniref:TonB-dependent receptor n=1 Tax=Rhodoplanes tepidamans TaxID=200616 RepID=A0ABT5JD80_RHOTP|nr:MULTISPECIES: TonB-dependent receptor [Rhodoplanes]MDC7787648.1 TonB-dependent receptor [Rhodoplanes tepidamans]MDC7984536.1 TonB-dependent receptor [Rhodoplanes sp. TEM]MDQ0355218.1 hemoglobin/transferrin/lactoferrin receptor protein [Rhodoplanes tepidamans]
MSRDRVSDGAWGGAVGRSRRSTAWLVTTALGAGVLAGLVGPVPARAQGVAVEARPFSIASQPLAAALRQFAEQSGMQLAYRTSDLQGLSSPGFRGTASRGTALAALLAGTGVSYTVTGTDTVTIRRPGMDGNAQASEEDGIPLDPIQVSGTIGSRADKPWDTAGAVNYISGEDLQRFPGTSAGDMFRGVPGVISASSRNGAFVDPNIRGLQGMNRVATTIDGSEQSTSTWRGYSGVISRTYVDPDLISNVLITKGPGGEAGGGGAIGGVISMETLQADDILKPGDKQGVRVKTTIGTNAVTPVEGLSTARTDEPSIFALKNGSASVAAASRDETHELVAAVAKRKTGNYFAGSDGDTTYLGYAGYMNLNVVEKPLSAVKHGQEVFNTSQDVTSLLLKDTLRFGDGHELKLGYMRYDNIFGEVTPTILGTGTSIGRQVPLSQVTIDTLTARYSYRPYEHGPIDFKLNSWISNTDETSVYNLYTDTFFRHTRTKNYGLEASNTTRLDLAGTPVTLRYGGSTSLEDASPSRRETDSGLIYPVDGTRLLSNLFVDGKWEPVPWLALQSGLRYLYYKVDPRGEMLYSYAASYPLYTGYEGTGASPSVGVTVTPIDGWQVWATYKTGIRPPSLRESTYSNSALIFNPALQPEKARNVEIGTNLMRNDLVLPGDKARLKVAWFDNVTDGYIGRQSSPSFQLSMFNYDKVEMRGVEVSGSYDARRAFVQFGVNWYTDVIFCPTPGTCSDWVMQSDYLANQIPPKLTATATVGARFFDERLTIGGRVSHVGARAGLVYPDYYAALGIMTKMWNPYMLVDAFVQWKIDDNLTLDITGDNLLDRYYVDALGSTELPAPGRTIKATLTGKFGTAEPLALQGPFWPFGRRDPHRTGAERDWSGLYVGGFAGYGFGQINGETTTAKGVAGGIPASESANQSPHGMLWGGQIGYNYQLPSRLVLGLEGDLAFTQMTDYEDVRSTEAATLVQRKHLNSRIDYEFDWLSTVRGRVGWSFGDLMIYGTGGLALMKETERRAQYRSTSATATPGSTEYWFTEKAAEVRTGWTVGAGAEYAIGGGWSIKGEYLYANFGDEEFVFPDARAGVGATYSYYATVNGRRTRVTVIGNQTIADGRTATNTADLHALKLGVNYRF